jgi:universal stress protein A
LEELQDNSRRDMDAMFDAKWKASHRFVVAVSVGTPVFEILRYAKEQEINLIVVGTLGRTGLSHLLLGSVAESVVQKAHCPVLVIHESGSVGDPVSARFRIAWPDQQD